MPNWIKNELVAYNLDVIGKTALEVAFGHNRPFQRLYPMPKILEDTQSPTPKCIEDILGRPARNASLIPDGFEFFASSVGKNDLKQKILELGVDEVMRRIHEDKPLDDHDVSKVEFAITAIVNALSNLDGLELFVSSLKKSEWRHKILELGVDEVMRRIRADKTLDERDISLAELAVTAIVKTGYSNWYDWCVDNWGVKWDVDAVHFMHPNESAFEDDEESEPDLLISFDTAWAPPTGILKRISEQYPDARFYLRWADEFGPGNGVGLLFAEAGMLDEKKIDDEEDFFNKLWGYDEDD